MKKILVIAAHPDDEILECGGTIAKMVKSGEYEAEAIIVCEGESLRYEGMNVDQKSATAKAAEIIGYKNVECLNLPDQRLDTFSLIDINKKIENVCDRTKPEVVFTHWLGDLNKDHRIVAESTCIALRPTSDYIKSIYMFCNNAQQTGSYTEFKPNLWVDISETLEVKIEAFRQYTSEIREYPHARSIEALEVNSHAIGVQCNRKAAETFYVYRTLI